ncbi:MAG: DUF5683 domain-containing protein [Bacteroidetes bacterium]|nr:DUF5683 domain-containing protein [Bacteroidota bacterium]
MLCQSGLKAQDSSEHHDAFERTGLIMNALEDSLKSRDTIDVPFVMTRSPLKAVLYSMALPGLGQLYNKSYWKIPVIWAFGGYFIYEIVNNNNKYLDYKDAYLRSQTPYNPTGDQRLKTIRDFYRDQRDQFYLYAALVYMINIFDAYVDAHLFDFDVSDKMRVGLFKDSKKLINFKLDF